MYETVYQGNRGEGAVRQIERDVFEVESFTTPGKFYTTDLANMTCDCPATKFGYGCSKHLVLADAVAAIPSGPGASVAVERVTELCREIFSRHNDPIRSYRCVTDVLFYGRSTEAMKRAVVLRHGKRVA